MRIVDGHAHVASMRFIPKAFVAGAAKNIVASNARNATGVTAAQAQLLLEAQHQDHQADALVKEMDQAGVAMTVLLIPEFSWALECPLPIAEMAALHHQIRLRHPGRFYVFQGIDPRDGQAGVDFFESTVRDFGFNGLKLYPPCGYSPSDERLFPFYEICKTYNLPVLLHTGPTSPVLEFSFAHPALINAAAKNFPEVNFILAHGGVNYVSDASLQCAYRPNVYLDIAGFPSALHPGGWRQQLRELFRQGINHKIIFGTDWPLTRLAGSTKDRMDELLASDGPFAGVSTRDIESIMSGTIERLIPKVIASQTEIGNQERIVSLAEVEVVPPRLSVEFRWPQTIDESLGAAVIALYNDTIRTQTILGYAETLDAEQSKMVIERMDESVRRGDKAFFGIYRTEQLIGMALLTPNALPNCRHIVDWSKGVIHSDFRGRGVLRQALLALAQHCVLKGWDLITLDVRANTRAHRLWSEMGFEEFGRLQDYARVDGVSEAGAYMYATTRDLIAKLERSLAESGST